MASVVSMNGAPRIAPVPISSPAALPDKIAIKGEQRLRQRGADCGQDRADRALGQSEALADPLDAVREEFRARQDHDERREELDPGHEEAHAWQGGPAPVDVGTPRDLDRLTAHEGE